MREDDPAGIKSSKKKKKERKVCLDSCVSHQRERTVLKSIIIIETRKKIVNALTLILNKCLHHRSDSFTAKFALKCDLGFCTKHFSSRCNCILLSFPSPSSSWIIKKEMNIFISFMHKFTAKDSSEKSCLWVPKRASTFTVKTDELVAKMGHTLGCGKQMCLKRCLFADFSYDALYFLRRTCLIKLELCFQKE